MSSETSPNLGRNENNRPAIHCEIGTDELSLGQQLDKHAPEKCKSFAIREENEWMTDEVQTVKRQKMKK